MSRVAGFVETDFAEDTIQDDLDGAAEDFDRATFAMNAIALIGPRDTTVAVCAGMSRLRVEAGRAWGRGARARWALVSIPKTASRRAIALALTSLLPDAAARPYALDVLLREPHEPGPHRDGDTPARPFLP